MAKFAAVIEGIPRSKVEGHYDTPKRAAEDCFDRFYSSISKDPRPQYVDVSTANGSETYEVTPYPTDARRWYMSSL